MDELVSSELGNIWNDETTDDIGDFSLNNLDMNNQTNQTWTESPIDVRLARTNSKTS